MKLTNATIRNGDGAVKDRGRDARFCVSTPTRPGAGEVYAYEIRILQGFGVGISIYSRQA